MQRRRPHLLVLNQYYWPGVEATAHLLSELCADLATEFDVTVVTGKVHSRGGLPREETVQGVRIVRVNSTAFERVRLIPRAVNYITYFIQSLREGLSQGRPDIVLCMTDPPFIANVALAVARRFRVPLVVVSQDVFPEVAIELNRLTNPALVGILRMMIHYYLERADRIVAIGTTMQKRLEEKGAPHERTLVIPNWIDTTRVHPSSRASEWAEEHGLTGKFVVMHSGNIGHAHDLDNLVRASTFLRDLDNLSIVIIGAGARHGAVAALADRIEADHVRFLPYQPRAVLSQSLSAADIHFVGLAQGLSGYVVPSRLYGILAVGRPVIAAAEDDSETAEVVRTIGCGIVIPPGRPELLAGVIRDARAGVYDLRAMGERGREFVASEADRSVAVGRYRDLLKSLVPA